MSTVLRQQIAIKAEATPGTAETLAAGNVVLHSGAATFEPNIPMQAREGMSASASSFGSIPTTRAGNIKFKMKLRGTTGAPVASSNEPDFSVPLKGCGFALTVSGTTPNEQASYKPSTAAWSAAGAYHTVGLYMDGKLYLIYGAVGGNLSITCNVGEPVLAEFEFVGLYKTPTDASLLVPTYPTVVEPTFQGAAVSIQGYTTPRLKTLKIDVKNKVAMRPYPNDANGTGFFTAQITGRDIVGSFDPEEVLAATKNWFNEWVTGATGSITTGAFPSGGTNYNQFQFTIPKAAYTKVGLADREGLATAPVDFECRRNSDAGDDELEILQT